ncbi:hypothetical protein GCM10022200_17180 [Microbacterium awajiense]|uniref:Thiamine pyrophosphate enzyme N-terminal TPP-binding domain-containing protein n=1 Tax=Microbacterium awajiense TaxID=415214 RepID=A0ABP7AKN3_9MICO
MTVTVRDSAFRLLRDLGLRTVFAGPAPTASMFHDVPDDFRRVDHAHDWMAVVVAAGYAQTSHRPALVHASGEFGVVSAVGHLLAARADRTPLIVLAAATDDDPTRGGPWSQIPSAPVTTLVAETRRRIPRRLVEAHATVVERSDGPVVVLTPHGSGHQSVGRHQSHTLSVPARPVVDRATGPAVDLPRVVRGDPGDRLRNVADIIRVLRGAAPADTVLVDDGRSVGTRAASGWASTPRALRYSSAQRLAGWEIPFALGVALAQRDLGRNRSVLVVTTAMSLQASVQALATALVLALPLVVVVLDGAGCGPLARAFGAAVETASTRAALGEAVASAWWRERPTIIGITPAGAVDASSG